MGEALTTSASDMESLSLESVRSRLWELSASLDDALSSSDDSISQPKKLLKDLHRNLLVVAEDPIVASLGSDELEAYIEQLKKMINLEEEENLKVSEEFHTLESIVLRDSTKLKGDLEAFSSLVDFIDSKGVFSTQTGIADDSSVSGSILGSSMPLSDDYKLEIFELSQLIENRRSKLATLEDLHDVMERLEAVNSLKDFFCGVKCIQIEDKCIRFSLRTPIPVMNYPFSIGRPNSYLEPFVLDHELLVEINDTMELKNVEIFPADVHLDDIIMAIESRCLSISKVEDTFQWLIRKVQQHIILCTLRHLMVKDASKSRGSCTYCDADKTVTACINGGVKALIKVNYGWPLSSYPLTLRSVEHADNLSKSISWSSLCKVKEQANSLDIQTRCNLTHFLDSIEQLVLEYNFC